MPVTTSAEPGKVLEVTVSGKLHHADYVQFVPVVERLIAERGKLRLLVRMHEFHGWDAGALWDDIKFDLKHFADIERLALVGETRWERGMATFCKPFTRAKVRFFPPTELDQARTWLAE